MGQHFVPLENSATRVRGAAPGPDDHCLLQHDAADAALPQGLQAAPQGHRVPPRLRGTVRDHGGASGEPRSHSQVDDAQVRNARWRLFFCP